MTTTTETDTATLTAYEREILLGALYSPTHHGHLRSPGETDDGGIDPRWCNECGSNQLPDVEAVVEHIVAARIAGRTLRPLLANDGDFNA